MKPETKWYVITGGPSSGITTTAEYLEEELGYKRVPEVARMLIDKGIEKGKTIEEIRRDEKKFQQKVLQAKIEKEYELPKYETIFLERGIPDSIAYYENCGLNPKEAKEVSPRDRYRKVFFLELLPFEKDYARVEDKETRKWLEAHIYESYLKLGYDVFEVPELPLKDRLKMILDEVII